MQDEENDGISVFAAELHNGKKMICVQTHEYEYFLTREQAHLFIAHIEEAIGDLMSEAVVS